MIRTSLKANLNANTYLYGLIGNPVKYSLSPILHNALFNYFSYNAVYLTFNVDDIRLAVDGIRGLDIKGCSVTAPYKISIMKYLDHIDDTALKINAVNTIINDNGKLIGYNYDCDGAMFALSELVDINELKVVLLGAGGSARAIGYGIKSKGGNLKIINRNKKKGKQLAFELDADFCKISDLFNEKIDILINATSIGMYPKVGFMPIPEEILNSEMIIMDIVYYPIETMLLKTGKKIGCNTVDGLTMLAYQGALQFKCWTKLKPSLGFIKKILRSKLV